MNSHILERRNAICDEILNNTLININKDNKRKRRYSVHFRNDKEYKKYKFDNKNEYNDKDNDKKLIKNKN